VWGPRAVKEWRLAAACAAAGSAADLDFLPGLLIGDAGAFHHGLTHSVGAAALFAGVLAAWAPGGGRCRWLLFGLLAYGSHVLLDALARDTSAPYGVPALWPVSVAYWNAPVPAFEDIRREDGVGEFLSSLFSAHNARAVARELALMGPVAAVAIGCSVRRSRRPPS
jgi:inner membrane protein